MILIVSNFIYLKFKVKKKESLIQFQFIVQSLSIRNALKAFPYR